jgi:hypothetical protein
MRKRFLVYILSIAFIVGVFSCQKEVDYGAQISKLNLQVDSLKNSRDSLAKALLQSNLTLVDLQKSKDSLAGVLVVADSVYKKLSLSNNNLLKSLDTIKTQLSGISTQLTGLTTQLTLSNANITTINTQLASLNQQYSDLLTKFNAILLQLNNISPFSLSTGLVAYYPFTGNALDSSGNGNNGTVNGASLTTDRFGNINSAYYFNGNGNSIGVTNKTLSLSGNFTFSCWVKINNLAPTYYDEAIFSQWDDRKATKFLIGFRSYNNQAQTGFSFYKFGSNVGYLNYQTNWTATTTWNQIVATYEQGYISKIYINGQMAYSTTNVPSALSNPSSDITPIEIGHAHGQYGDLWFNGLIDDIRVHSRILSDAEISYLATH